MSPKLPAITVQRAVQGLTWLLECNAYRWHVFLSASQKCTNSITASFYYTINTVLIFCH